MAISLMISAQINRLGMELLLIFVIIGITESLMAKTGCKDTYNFRNKKEKPMKSMICGENVVTLHPQKEK